MALLGIFWGGSWVGNEKRDMEDLASKVRKMLVEGRWILIGIEAR